MTENPHYKIALAGCGKMGAAMATAWLTTGIAARLDILDPSPLPADIAAHKAVTAYTDENAFRANADHWDILIIAVKPQILTALCQNLSPLPARTPVLSIAAGQSLRNFAAVFGARHPVIRAMPNTPAAIGRGITVAVPAQSVTEDQKTMADALLCALGKTAWIDDEGLMDAVTALSGSGPAYVFYLIEAMAKAGAAAGLPEDMATRLARQTVIGAAALAESDSATPAGILRQNVTSPNGTTAAALEILMDGEFQDILTRAIAQAAERSRELSA